MKNANSRTGRTRITDEDVGRLVRLGGPRPRASEEASARVKAAVEVRWLETTRPRSRPRSWVLAAAAAIVLALLAVGILRQRSLPGGGSMMIARVETRVGEVRLVGAAVAPDAGAGLPAGAVLETGSAGRLALHVGEGLSVRIDADSRVRLQSGELLVLERGAVYVDSAPGFRPVPGRLTVRTPHGDVHDIGTQYEVRLGGSSVRVQVREGRIEIRHDDESYRAGAGTALTLDASGQVSRRSIPLHGPHWDWVLAVAPALDIEGLPLRDFLDWVSRESGRTVVYADAAHGARSAEILLSGTIEGLTPDEALAAVLPTCDLVHRVQDGYIFIDPAPED